MAQFVAAESEDSGKPLKLAGSVDIPRAIANLRFFADAAPFLPTAHHPSDGGHGGEAMNVTSRSPLGVVGLITPWNLPLYLLSWKVAPAVVMGNAVVAKPSELTPSTASMMAEVFTEAGAPPGLVNVVQGLGGEVGNALVSHPSVKAVSFTGGTSTGRLVGKTAAEQFKKTSLELGGKNATLVFDDCGDVQAVAKAVARSSFLNSGQICLCGSRILLQEGIAQEFTEALVQQVQALKVGMPSDPSSDLGPLVSAAHRDKVEGYISLAAEEGGEVLCGGHRPSDTELSNGYYLEPTLVNGLSWNSRVATEEIFGPVATLHKFCTEEEAIQMANNVEYGLSSSVWTQSIERAHRVSNGVHVGMVWVNTWLHRDLRTPFGGVKASGLGREGGWYSLEFFSETKNICYGMGLAAPPMPGSMP